MSSTHKVKIGHVFKDIIWPRRNVLIAGFFLILFNRFLGMILPLASKSFLDDVIGNKDIYLLKILVAVIVAAIIIQTATSYVLTHILTIEAQRLISILRKEVQKKILQLPIHFFDNNNSGSLVSRVMHDVEGVRYLVGRGLIQLVGGAFTAIFSLVMMIRISPMMTLAVAVPFAILGIIYQRTFSYIRPIFRERGKIRAQVSGRLTETLSGIRIIKGFNTENQEFRTFDTGVEKLFENVKKSITYTSLVTSSGNLFVGVASAAIMAISGYLIVVTGDLTAGDFLSFTLFLGFMVAPILDISDIGAQLSEAFAGLDRTKELMDTPVEDDGKTRNIKLDSIVGNLVFNNVSFAYEEGKEVIRDISFESPAGSITALVGTSGSGKSTIASLTLSFLNPTKGFITVDGMDLSKISLASYRSQLGVVLQDDFLFEGTIRENILYARPAANELELQEAIVAAHIPQFTENMEKGLDTIIGERGVKLSGGQRQRLAIARAIIANPKILILDEATSSLDTESESLIKESLAKLMRGRTTLVIAHRLSTIQQADQILVVEKGQIVERGTHEQLIEKKERYYDLYTYQARL